MRHTEFSQRVFWVDFECGDEHSDCVETRNMQGLRLCALRVQPSKISTLLPVKWGRKNQFEKCFGLKNHGRRPVLEQQQEEGISCALATIKLPVFLGMTPNVLVLVYRHTSSRCRISECGNQQGVSRHAAYLYDPHGQASLLRELLSYVPGRFRRLRKCRLQNLQLFGLDRRTRTPPLWPRVAVVWGLVLCLRVPRLRVSVQRTCKTILYKNDTLLTGKLWQAFAELILKTDWINSSICRCLIFWRLIYSRMWRRMFW